MPDSTDQYCMFFKGAVIIAANRRICYLCVLICIGLLFDYSLFKEEIGLIIPLTS